MTLKERLKQMLDRTREEEKVEYERKEIERLKPIYADKPSVVSSLSSTAHPSPSFAPSTVSYAGWVNKAAKELPDGEHYVKHFSPEQLKELVIAHRRGHDISVFADPDQTPEQLRFIYTHAEFGENVEDYIHNLDFDPAAIEKRESAQFSLEVMDIHASRKIKKEEQYSVSSVSSLLEDAFQRSEATIGSGGKSKAFERIMD